MASLLTLSILTLGCLADDPPEGLAHAVAGDGPRVVFDLRRGDLPDAPLPNDVFTRADPNSPTGARLNFSLEADTQSERDLRGTLAQMDGFSVFAPITVRFDAPLDLNTVAGIDRPFAEDTVLVLDLDEGDSFGERVPLDLGRGYFPVVLPTLEPYFTHDPRAGESNLLFETVAEDQDGDGKLSALEDTDGDGRLDLPNVAQLGDDPEPKLLTFYERETDTLLIRPLRTLRAGRRYAVVLTRAVRGLNGSPVRSPFKFINHAQQTGGLKRLPEALERHGLSVDDVAFTWAFTTHTATRDLESISAGLGGSGVFAALADSYPPDVSRVEPLKNRDQPDAALLRTDELIEVMRALGSLYIEPAEVEAIASTFVDVDYLVAGRFVTPDFLVDDDGDAVRNRGGYPADDDEVFRLDYALGEVVAGTQEVPFWCTVPKARPGMEAPFPVVVYGHDYRRSRVESLAVAGTLARWGLATCALDAVGHGIVFGQEKGVLIDSVLDALGMKPIRGILEGPRARDLNNDGIPDPGGDTFTTNAPHSRDVIRQSAVEWLQFLRVVRGFDGKRRWSQPGTRGTTAGDFDGDGVVDLGGPGVKYHLMGTGYGGSLATIVAGVDGGIDGLVPICAGGGLADVATRATREGVQESAILAAMGPIIVGFPSDSGFTTVSFVVRDVTDVAQAVPGGDSGLPFAQLPPLVPGDRVTLENLDSGGLGEAAVDLNGAFRVTVSADSLSATDLRARFGLQPWRPDFVPHRVESTSGLGDRLRLSIYDAGGRLKNTIESFEEDVSFQGILYPGEAGERIESADLIAIAQGWGLTRQTPAFRTFAGVMQLVYDAADSVAYAGSAVALGARPLLILTAGDSDVPISTGFALARAFGLVQPADPRSAQLVDEGVVEGISRLRALVDADDLSDGGDGFSGPRFDVPARFTGKDSASGVRIALLSPSGAHGIGLPKPESPWDGATYLANLIGQFLAEGTAQHRPCLATSDCAGMPEHAPIGRAGGDR